MKRRLGIAGLLLVTGLVSAQAADAPGLDELRLRVMSFVHGKTVAAAREQAILLFRTLDIDGVPGISQADYDMAARIQWAQQRSYQIAAILAYDLDGDGQVTRAELQQAFGRQARAPIQQSGVALVPTGEQMKAVLDKLVETALEADANKDGIITFQEMLAHVDGKFKTQMANRHQEQVVPLALDRNGDGVVSLAEYTAALDIVLKEVDSDGDGQISAAEVQAYQQTLQLIQRAVQERAEQERQRAQIAAKVKTCGLPAVPAGAFVAVVSTFEGAAISNVAIGDDAQEIRAAQIDIQEGQQPIYVVATSQTGRRCLVFMLRSNPRLR